MFQGVAIQLCNFKKFSHQPVATGTGVVDRTRHDGVVADWRRNRRVLDEIRKRRSVLTKLNDGLRRIQQRQADSAAATWQRVLSVL